MILRVVAISMLVILITAAVILAAAVRDRVETVAGRFGVWGAMRCKSCRKSWRCISLCETVQRVARA